MTISVLFFLSTGVAAQNSKSFSPKSSQTAAINVYAKQIDRFMKRTNKRRHLFGNVGADKDDWRQLKEKPAKGETDPADLNEVAYVWTREGKVVGVGFEFQSDSRDWGHIVTCYFREDGSLAKIHARLNTFYGDVTRIRENYYNSQGRLLRTTAKYRDVQTQKPRKNPNFQEEPIPVYLTVRELPFFKLL